MWMQETRIRLFMQMELEACRDQIDWLIICYLCAVNDNPEEHCSPAPLSVPPDYHKNLEKTRRASCHLLLK